MVHPYSSTDTTSAGKKSRFILSVRSKFHMIGNYSITVHVFPVRMLTLVSVDKMLLLRYVKWSTNFKGSLYNVQIVPSCFKQYIYIYIYILFLKLLLKETPSANYENSHEAIRTEYHLYYFQLIA